MPNYQKAPKSMAVCPGEECPGCGSAGCYAKGGDVKGVNKKDPYDRTGGVSEAGDKYRSGISPSQGTYLGAKRQGELISEAKDDHRKTLSEIRSQKKPNLYADGGEVGVNKSLMHGKPGQSSAGHHVRAARDADDESDKRDSMDAAKRDAGHVLKSMQSMKKPDLYAEGGEVAGVSSEDDELNHAMGHEFLEACHKKDKKGIMSALEAIVLSRKGKE